MTEPHPSAASRTGLLHGIGAYLIWGLLPLYFAAVRAIDAGEVLAARIVFSLMLMVAIVAVIGGGARLRAAVTRRGVVPWLMLSATLISINWLTYIWAVQHRHVLEASLGYFLNPIINVLLGVVILHERLTRIQVIAVVFAGAGVAVLASGAGAFLWITFALALTFGFYGLIRKTAPVEALEGLTIETALLMLPAIVYLGWLATHGAVAFGTEWSVSLLLAFGGVVTAVPLLLFASAARKLPYSLLGLLQYVAPTLQFTLAVAVFGEPLTWRHIVCFALIGAGVTVFAVGTWQAGKTSAAA